MAAHLHLNGHHRVTLEKIFRHPVGQNIEWHDVVSLLDNVGTVVEEPNGRYVVTIGSQTETFDAPRHRDLDSQRVLDLRRMLEGAGITPQALDEP
jgi:hypothetical protein